MDAKPASTDLDLCWKDDWSLGGAGFPALLLSLAVPPQAGSPSHGVCFPSVPLPNLSISLRCHFALCEHLTSFNSPL